MTQIGCVFLEYGTDERMSSNNDWAPLKEVIIGTAKTYSVPKNFIIQTLI